MKKAKLTGGTSAASATRNHGTASNSAALPRKSIAVSRRPVEGADVRSGDVSKRKSCPAMGAGQPMTAVNAAAAYLTPERIAKVFKGDGEGELTEMEKKREVKRITMCWSNLNKSDYRFDNTALTSILNTLQSNVDGIHDNNWNIILQTVQYATSPKVCGSCFTGLERLVNEVLIHRPEYASAFLQLLIGKFVRYGNPGTNDGPSITELKCFDVATKLLCRIVEMIGVKILTRPLLNIMMNAYPYVLKPPLTHFYYTRNLVVLNKMAGNSLTYSILSVLIHKLTHLDSLIPREVLESDALQSIILPKQERNKNGNTYIITEDETEDLIEEILKSYDKVKNEVDQTPQIATLDICLSYLISYLDSVYETLNFSSLLSIFESEVLPTFNTNCVQYIFFHLINRKEEYLHAFMNFLWKKFSNVSTPTVLRIQAVAYIAGVLARSTKVDRRTLKRWISRLSTYAHEYLESKSSLTAAHWSNVNIHAHGPFYAVCQAIFYTFAFRHFELVYGNMEHLKLEDGKQAKPNLSALPLPSSTSSFIYSLNLQRLITSDLNPLKACIPSVAKAFVDAAHAYQISYCKTVLERNNRANIKNVIFDSMRDAASNSEDRSVNLLNESFFPFDPSPLAYCKMIVDDEFRPYDGNSLAVLLLGRNVNTSVDSTIKNASGSKENDNYDDSDDLDLDGDDMVDSRNILLVCE